jgi:hypothetical protein
MKKCTDCKNEYPPSLSYFYKAKYGKDKLMSICKKCMGIRSIEQKNKKKYKKMTQYNFPQKIYV